MRDFQNQLHGVWRAAGLSSSPRPDGSGITFVCPKCANVRLEVTEKEAACPECFWTAKGESWVIAEQAQNAVLGVALVVTGAKPTVMPLWTYDELMSYVPDDKEEIWPDGILSMGERTAIVGAPGVGKSRLSLQAAICTILGKPFLGWETKGKGLKWMFLQTENSARRLQFDLQKMTSHLTIDEKKQVGECLRILNVNALDFSSICMVPGHADRVLIESTLASWVADIVVVDPLRDAGRGDPNKDSDMTETCQGIASVVRKNNPKAVALVVHHGRTGASEASKVFGDDAASFGRNSKVLYGWLRSQINVSEAGVDYPNIVIVGCGKNSNGKKWEPFAAQLDEVTMIYRRLTPQEFDLAAWEKNMSKESSKRDKPTPTPGQVAEVLRANGGRMTGEDRNKGGLCVAVRKKYKCTIESAEDALNVAVDCKSVIATRAGNSVIHTLPVSASVAPPAPVVVEAVDAEWEHVVEPVPVVIIQDFDMGFPEIPPRQTAPKARSYTLKGRKFQAMKPCVDFN